MLTLVLIGVLAGSVTAVSPCVLPVLPVVFFGAGSLRIPGPGSLGDDQVRGGTVGTVQCARRDGAVRIVAGLVLSFAVLTLAGSIKVTALHLPTGALRWAGPIVLFLADGVQRWAPTYTEAIQGAVEGNDATKRAIQELTAPATAPGDTTVDAAAPGVSGPMVTCRSAAEALANCGPAPDLIDVDTWINAKDGAPVTIAALRGKVVLVDFWTFACINCQHVLPSVTAWYETHHHAGLEVIGVHTPEFAFNTTRTTSGRP